MEDDRLTKKIFLRDHQICKNNWSNEMKKLFTSIGSEAFGSLDIMDLTRIEDKLKSLILEGWRKDILKKPKLRTYSLFKDDILVEDYVRLLKGRRDRSLYAQFRHGILPLKIETGRFQNLDIQERLCEFCSLGEVEDEIHFLCVCTLYSDIRINLYDAIDDLEFSRFHDDRQRFTYLMKFKFKEVSNFISSAWSRRQQKLYRVT